MTVGLRKTLIFINNDFLVGKFCPVFDLLACDRRRISGCRFSPRRAFLQDTYFKELVFLLFFSARDCGPLPVPRNGSYFGDLTVFPNKILFGCDEGFNLMGSVARHCQETGTWSGNLTFCEGKLRKYFLACTLCGYLFLD